MKNTILNFKTREQMINGKKYFVPDYFSKKVNVFEFFNNLPNKEYYAFNYTLNNNDKLERLQFEYYNNTDYWDVIAMVNGMDPLVGVPLDDDYNRQEQVRFQDEYFKHYYREDNRNEQYLRDYYEASLVELSQNTKSIVLIIPQKMQEFLSLLRFNGFID